MSYIFFPDRGETPQTIARKREIADRIMYALGDGIALRVMRNRLNSQFPEAPGGGGQQPPDNPLRQKIVEGITGNRAPWQFSAAPTPSPQQPMPSPTPEMAGSGSGGGLGGFFRGLMNFKPGGLW